MFAKVLILLYCISFNVEYISDVMELFLPLEYVMSSYIFLLWGLPMGRYIVEYELEEEILITIVDGIVLILLFLCWLLLLSVSCEDLVENDINLLLLGTYSCGMNTSLIILVGKEKFGKFNVYLLLFPINEQLLYLICSL